MTVASIIFLNFEEDITSRLGLVCFTYLTISMQCQEAIGVKRKWRCLPSTDAYLRYPQSSRTGVGYDMVSQLNNSSSLNR